MMRRTIHILMEGAPADVDPNELCQCLQSIEGVVEIHHLHLWELDEHRRAMEAHVVVDNEHIARWAEIKREIKRRLSDRYHIHHSTVEFESPSEESCQPCPPSGDGHC
jgi:cobalt-zinc-cadmium efflux system protein